MTLNKEETARLAHGGSADFWALTFVICPNSYDHEAESYNAVVDKVTNGIQYGINMEDETVDISNYPIHPNPLITRPRFS